MTKYDLMTWGEFDQLIVKLAEEVKRDGKPDLILSITRGGLVPAVALAHKLKLGTFKIKTIAIQRHRDDAPYPEDVAPHCDAFDYTALNEKKILIVDDIIGSGETMEILKSKLESCGVTNYVNCVLVVSRRYNDQMEATVNYHGRICSKWLVFPWETKPS